MVKIFNNRIEVEFKKNQGFSKNQEAVTKVFLEKFLLS